MNTIIAATDFSTAGNRAVLRAADIAARTDARLHVFYAARMSLTPEQATHFAALVEGYFDTLRAQVQCRYGPALKVTGTDAAKWQEIYEVIDRQKADLLVVGPHVHPSGLDAFHGTFVERLAADCPVPLLISTSDPATPHRLSLASVDLGPESESAISVLRSVAPEAEITLMRIAPQTAENMARCGGAEAEVMSPTLESAAKALARFRDQVGLNVQTRIIAAQGDPRARIREEVASRAVDLVVLTGANPMGGLQTDFVKAPPCNLLVFPTALARQPA
ncbi:universal stress protein [uncultured Limimaricola sp.]|uniref:universal stress protein n=1 Tax=uncultured Limimaricola sp. TaxID=2211667 RepID=UPI0030F51D41